jgi:hypothetical protein
MLPTPSTLATILSRPQKRPRSGHRHGITDAERREIRQYWANAPEDAKPTQVQIAAWFSAKFHPISQSTVSDSLKPIYNYLDTGKKLQFPDRLARKDGKWPELEAALHQWQLSINRQNNTVTGLLFQEMARRFWLRMPQYRDLPVPQFSLGWLDGFKARYSISRRKRHGEAGKVDLQQLEIDLTEVRSIIDDYPLTDVYNMDETALYWKSSPDNSLASEELQGGETDKSRITATFCCNADGSHKLDIFFIAKALRPRAFKGIKHIESLGCQWKKTGKGWMNGTVFQEFLDWFKQQVGNRKVLLLIDGYGAHHTGLDCWITSGKSADNIRVEFLPPNTTSVCQPLDQGIIRAWKAYYRRQWVRFQADCYENDEDPFQKMTLLKAVRWAIDAWQDNITLVTIANCWLKSRVLGPNYTPMTRWQAE